MVEIIGFIISLLALLYLFLRQNIPAERRAPPPSYQEEELEEEDSLREFMKAVEKEAAARRAAQHVPPPPPPPKITKQPKKAAPSLAEHRLASQIEQRQLRSSLEERHLPSRFNQREELPGRTLALAGGYPRAEEEKKHAPSRVQVVVQRLANRKDMIIYQEIMDKPKSLRPY